MPSRKKRKPRVKKRWLFIAAVAAASVAALYMLQNVPEVSRSAKVYFFNGGKLAYVERRMPEKADRLFFAAEQLLEGPSPAEKAKGYFSQIPQGTRLRLIRQKSRTVIADFSGELAGYGGGTAKVEGMLAQIVYSLTQFEGVRDVQILVDGKREAALGSEGYIIDKPLSRGDINR